MPWELLLQDLLEGVNFLIFNVGKLEISALGLQYISSSIAGIGSRNRKANLMEEHEGRLFSVLTNCWHTA